MRLAYAFSTDLARSKIVETKVGQAMTRYNVKEVELPEIFLPRWVLVQEYSEP